MNIIKKIIGRIFIPKNTPYCHYRFKYMKKYDTYGTKPCIFWEDRNDCEYCKYLKKNLDIPDMVKDCEIK